VTRPSFRLRLLWQRNIRFIFCITGLSVSLAAGLLLTGCHRGYYRRQADSEARTLIREKLNDPRWCQTDPSLEISPDSRMHDPFSADHPPLPPDDPASHQLMNCVDGKKGYEAWHANGDTSYISNPEWRSYLPVNGQGIVRINMDEAINLAFLHSPTWQQQKETLYLSALDVSLERFGFDTQAFYGWSSFFRTQGPQAPGGDSSSFELGGGPNRTQLRRLGATGANLAVGIANTVIWNFSGPNTQSASTLIDFSLVQPLLRRAGRDRIMESLTQAERTLLANVRQIEQFRQGFYLNVITGRNPGAGPSAAGSFLNEPGAANQAAGGFLGLLQDQQQLRIAEYNVQSLQSVLDQFRAFFNEERVDLLQVRQAETSLYRAQESLLTARVNYQNTLDTYKRTLGLPPDVPLEVRDPLLERFKLIDDQLLNRQQQIRELLRKNSEGLSLISPEKVVDADGFETGYRWNAELEQALRQLPGLLPDISPVIEAIRDDDAKMIREDIRTFSESRQERVEKLAELRKFVEENPGIYEIEDLILQETAIEQPEKMVTELAGLIVRLEGILAIQEKLRDNLARALEQGPTLGHVELKNLIDNEILREVPEIPRQLQRIVVELTLIQTRARSDSITLPEVDLEFDSAFAIALQFRRDLMNARASLVDRWRRIEFVADDLESTLDLVFEGGVGNVGDNPFRVNWENSRFAAGIRFDAPITRLSERNAYRRTLIEYQQARRQYYGVEDSINQNLRRTIRALQQSRVLFELNRRSIQVAIQQVELSQTRLTEPPRPGAGGAAGGRATGLGPTAANDLTRALDSLQGAQNQFVRTWVTYEVLRRGLDFDLGTMQLTSDGMWLDPGIINVDYAFRAAEAFGIDPAEIRLPGTEELVTAPFAVPEQQPKFVPADVQEAPVEVPVPAPRSP
jgi:Outer membrane efflux protein